MTGKDLVRFMKLVRRAYSSSVFAPSDYDNDTFVVLEMTIMKVHQIKAHEFDEKTPEQLYNEVVEHWSK